jgi:hypothetical protein
LLFALDQFGHGGHPALEFSDPPRKTDESHVTGTFLPLINAINRRSSIKEDDMAEIIWSWEFNKNRIAPEGLAAQGQEAVPPPPIKDEYWQRLLKAVPVQAVGFITAADALAHAAPADFLTLALGAVFVFGFVVGYLEMTVLRHATRLELGVALGAYVVWVYAQGGVFQSLGWWQPVLGGLIALGYAALLRFFPQS